MLAKTIVILIFFAILGSLGSGLVFLVKDKGQSNRTVRALTVRIGLSIGLFILLFILFASGVIAPHGVRP
jgi:small neutral amino acid transporter SnatA (MarC family)